MNHKLMIVSIVCIMVLPSCYIQRYHQIKKQYETFQKDYQKVRRTNLQLKNLQKIKNDSIRIYQKKIETCINEITVTDSLIEVYTKEIREKLGKDPWGDSVKTAARQAATASFMTDQDEDVVYWLNLARFYPDLFAEMSFNPYRELYHDAYWLESPQYYYYIEKFFIYTGSCYTDMATMKPRGMLTSNEYLYKSAECHAIESGKTGYVGHTRSGGCKSNYNGECCSYGFSKGLDIIIQLLVDYDVPSLGHRRICLGYYRRIGVSVQPHQSYQFNTVLDFN